MEVEEKNRSHPMLPQLRSDIRVYAAGEGVGYIETRTGILKVKSPYIEAFVQEIVPQLTGQKTVTELQIGTQIPLEVVEEMIQSLAQADLLASSAVETVTKQAIPCVVVGKGKLATSIYQKLKKDEQPLLSFVEVEQDLPLDDLIEREEEQLVVVAFDSALDPTYKSVNEWVIQRKKQALFVSMDNHRQAWIGPLRDPDRGGACYQCLRLRLEMNDEQGKLLHEFASYLQREQEIPLVQIPDVEELDVMVSLVRFMIKQRTDGWEQTAESANRVLRFNGEKKSTYWHTLLPVPKCEACYTEQKAEGEEKEQKSQLLQAVDAHTGIVNRYTEVSLSEDDPAIYSYASATPDLSMIKSDLPMYRHSGAGYTRQQAINSAVGETLERYASSIYEAQELPLLPYNQMEKAVHPEQFQLFSPEQYQASGFPFQPFTESTPVCWSKGFSIGEYREAWVPASLVYLPYRRQKGEALITLSLSTGLAAGPSLEDAILTGLYEVMERDALSLSWLTKLPPRQVPEERLANLSLERLGLRNERTTPFLFDISLDLPFPIFLAMIEREEEKKILHFGSAARTDPESAMKKALLEAAQCIPYIRGLVRNEKQEEEKGFTWVDTFQKHALYYNLRMDLRTPCHYLLSSSWREELARRPLATWNQTTFQSKSMEPKAEIRQVVKALKEEGYEAIAVDLTTPDLRQIGIHVVRVLIPGFNPLSGNHAYRFLGEKRRAHLERKWNQPLPVMNEYPHPFP
nr:McmD1 [Thermoactinomyces sp.]